MQISNIDMTKIKGRNRERDLCILFAKKPVAPVTRMVLFSRKLRTLVISIAFFFFVRYNDHKWYENIWSIKLEEYEKTQ